MKKMKKMTVKPKRKILKYNLTLSKEVFITITIIMDTSPKNANSSINFVKYVKAMNII
jgi:hypothetical protein